MLIVAERGREAELVAVFEKWDLHAVVIGRITDDGRGCARWKEQVVADLPIGGISDDAPVYDRPVEAPMPIREVVDTSVSARSPSPAEALRAIISSPNVASKRMVFRQYDSLVQGNTGVGPGGEAAGLRN